MRYVKLNDLSKIGSLTDLFPNTSFPETITSDLLNSLQVVEVVELLPFNTDTQRLVYGNTYVTNNIAYTCQVVDMTSDEQQLYQTNKIQGQWNSIRQERNRRLSDCDWTQVPDSPADKQAWITYRQQLRDLPTQPDPFNINWPTKP
jgi:hypothetical protein